MFAVNRSHSHATLMFILFGFLISSAGNSTSSTVFLNDIDSYSAGAESENPIEPSQPDSEDWSRTASKTVSGTWKSSVEYLTYSDRPYYFSAAAALVLCPCCCCCAAFLYGCCCTRKKKPIHRQTSTAENTHNSRAQSSTQSQMDRDFSVTSVRIDMGSVRSEADGDGDERGELIFQTEWYTKEQMLSICNQSIQNSKCFPFVLNSSSPLIVFGDNATDRSRQRGVPRKYYGGQAKVMGQFDRLGFTNGITTTFPSPETPIALPEFQKLMDEQFAQLGQNLLQGNDVVIPQPSQNEIDANQDKYFQHGQQVIFHNIGTGIASLPFTHTLYIQQKIDTLQQFAKQVRTVRYYKYTPQSSLPVHVHGPNPNAVVCCPLCTQPRHYLIQLKHCNHKLCELCLRSYIHECLVYTDNPMQHRFKCWAAAIGNCDTGHLCMEDIEYAADRCTCTECKQDNTETGTGTILDMQPYHEFRNVMQAMNVESPWDRDECPQCYKPFAVRKFGRKPHTDQDDLQHLHDHCNCCGRSSDRDDDKEDCEGSDEGDEEEEVATTAYHNEFNHCNICKHYYCDQCRKCCFYEINQQYTVMPPQPVQEAIIAFNRQHVGMHGAASTSVFECCEICWFRYYCRECPHCQYCFCVLCRSRWSGCTQDWKAVDEKHGKHDAHNKHYCHKRRALVPVTRQPVRKEKKKKKHELSNTAKQQKWLLAAGKLAAWKAKALQLANEKSQANENDDGQDQESADAVDEEEEKEIECSDESKETQTERADVSSRWQWNIADTGNYCWKAYDGHTNKTIERLALNETYNFECSETKRTYKITKLSPDKAVQIDTKTNVCRDVRRKEMFFASIPNIFSGAIYTEVLATRKA